MKKFEFNQYDDYKELLDIPMEIELGKNFTGYKDVFITFKEVGKILVVNGAYAYGLAYSVYDEKNITKDNKLLNMPIIEGTCESKRDSNSNITLRATLNHIMQYKVLV